MVNFVILDLFKLDPDDTPDLYITDLNNNAKYILREVRNKYPNIWIENRKDSEEEHNEIWTNDQDYKFVITANYDILREIELICANKYNYIRADDSF